MTYNVYLYYVQKISNYEFTKDEKIKVLNMYTFNTFFSMVARHHSSLIVMVTLNIDSWIFHFLVCLY